MDASKLTYEERKAMLASLLFITEKRNGDIHARKVAVGSNQHTYKGYKKKKRSLPTVCTSSIILTGVVGTHYHMRLTSAW